MTMPEHVLMNDDIHGQCVSDKQWPRIMMDRFARENGCHFKIEWKRRFVKDGENTIYCLEFVIRNVTATCEYKCTIGGSEIIKKWVVVSGM